VPAWRAACFVVGCTSKRATAAFAGLAIALALTLVNLVGGDRGRDLLQFPWRPRGPRPHHRTMAHADTPTVSVQGNPDGRLLVFLHGWPDDPEVWRHQVAHFEARHGCARVQLPNYGARIERPRGLDFPTLRDRIIRSIEDLCDRRGQDRVVLVGHDWGAYLSYLVEQAIPERIAGLVTIDVGGDLEVRSPKQAWAIVSYQWPLIAAWLVGGVAPALGAKLTASVARAVRAPLENRSAPPRSSMNYLYFYLWRSLLLPPYSGRLLRRYRPSSPTLYLYGTRKPFQLQSRRWLEMLEADPGSKTVALDGGHWLMLSHPEQVNAAIEQFLDADVAWTP
jgi:pimeloyl-ACP methyl ester carboxylesterase